jgi:hypothetical protein
MADLSTLDFGKQAEEGATVTLRNPIDNSVLTDDSGKEMTITVVGMDSQTFQKAENFIANQRIAKMQRSKGKLGTAEESRNDEVELLSRVTLGWHIQLNGEIQEFNAANARKVYTSIGWIREQLKSFIEDRANFLKS